MLENDDFAAKYASFPDDICFIEFVKIKLATPVEWENNAQSDCSLNLSDVSRKVAAV